MRVAPTMAEYGIMSMLTILPLFAGTAQSQPTEHLQSTVGAAPTEETTEIAALKERVGELYRAGKFAEAIPLAQSSLERTEKALGPTHPDVAIGLNNLAELYRYTGQYAQAEPLYQRALAINERALGADHPSVATSLHNLAVLYSMTGQYAEAESLYQQALAIREKALGSEHPEVASTLNSLGALYDTRGQYAEALPLLQRALAIDKKALGRAHPRVADSLTNLAVLDEHMGHYQQALSRLQLALAIRQNALGPAHPDVATSLNNLAALYMDIGQFSQALPFLQQALAIREKALGSEHPEVAATLVSLAALYQMTGQYAKAEPLLQRALAIDVKAMGPDHPVVAINLNNLATLYQKTGQYAKAEPLVLRALAIDVKAMGPDHPVVASMLEHLATLYQKTGQYAKAEPLLQRALATKKKALGPTHPSVASNLGDLAVLAAAQQRYQTAVDFYRQSLQIEDRYIQDVFAFTTEAQQLRFIRSISGTYLGYLSLIDQQLSHDQTIVRDGLEAVLRRKGVVFDAQARTQAAVQGHMSGSARREWEQLSHLRSELARLSLNKPDKMNADAYREQLAMLQGQIDETERSLARQSPLVAVGLTQRTVTAAAVAKALPQTGALVEFVKIQDYDFPGGAFRPVSHYLAFVLTAAGEVTLVDLGEASTLEKLIGQALEDLRVAQLYGHRQAIAQSLVSLNQLSTTLWAPLMAALGEAQEVLLSPDGLLNLVPFAALADGKGHFLLEQYRLAYITSGRELVGTTNAMHLPATDLLLVANPAFDSKLTGGSDSGGALRSRDFQRHFSPLPGTEREAEEIPLLVSGPDTRKQVLTGTNATEGRVKSAHSTRILHLATHAFFLDDQEPVLETPVPNVSLVAESTTTRGTIPFQSKRYENPLVRAGLALTGANHAADTTTGDDGILTALEITGMDLQETELVVLSACETAVGTLQTGEGVFGLRRAFALAGAKNLLMSLWPVDDHVTADQMKSFYQNRRTLPPAEALRQAQLETINVLKDAFGVANPGLWAPFILQGALALGT